MPPPTAEEQLTAAFNSHFKTAYKPAVVSRLLGSAHVREWYAQYRLANAAVQALPDQWEEAGLTPTEWSAAQAARTARSRIRAEMQSRLAEEAQKYKDACEVVHAEADLGLRQHASPMVLALEGGYEQLSLAAQGRIEETADAESRSGQLKAELATARKAWVKSARKGENPF